MAYQDERPDMRALDGLEQLLRHVADELAGWRRRCLRAEAELQEMRSRGGVLAGPELTQATQRIVELETDNEGLRQRADTAKERVRALAGRLSFLEQGSDGPA